MLKINRLLILLKSHNLFRSYKKGMSIPFSLNVYDYFRKILIQKYILFVSSSNFTLIIIFIERMNMYLNSLVTCIRVFIWFCMRKFNLLVFCNR